MDLSHLHKLVTAAIDEADTINDTGPVFAELEAYLDKIVPRVLREAGRKEAFVQGYLRGRITERGGEIAKAGDYELLDLLGPADAAYIEYRARRT